MSQSVMILDTYYKLQLQLKFTSTREEDQLAIKHHPLQFKLEYVEIPKT